MNYKFKKVAVLGSGVMGSGIACHLANIGMKVILLDLTYKPKDSKEKNYDKNKIVNDSLSRIVKSKPSPLYDKKFVNRIETGNFDDDIIKISQVDWIIEVIIENVEIKKKSTKQNRKV
jgi:3-hydroxyacyl-CoA dehydrogenase